MKSIRPTIAERLDNPGVESKGFGANFPKHNTKRRQALRAIFTARRYASAVLTVIVCLSVCPSVHLSVTSRILKFSLVISLVCYKDTDIEALVPASVSHHCLVLSCLVWLYSIHGLSSFELTFIDCRSRELGRPG